MYLITVHIATLDLFFHVKMTVPDEPSILDRALRGSTKLLFATCQMAVAPLHRKRLLLSGRQQVRFNVHSQ